MCLVYRGKTQVRLWVKVYKGLVGKRKEKDRMEYFRVGRKIILTGKWDERTWIGFLWLKIRTCGRLL